ncbi:MAG: hypothetical protein JSS30_07330 [Verrucomicrobia bacterium]|nr:hypothetical protein [Verrucomicrobiota bacterium]
MPARIIQNGDRNHNKHVQKVHVKAPVVNSLKQEEIAQEMEALLSNSKTAQVDSAKSLSTVERAQFYTGSERLNLQGNSVQRVRELQEENDHLQREIVAKEEELVDCTDPLVILADIEHRKVIIARNTGEILKIYLRNEERLKRIKELQNHNTRIQNEMMEMQGRFIATKDMSEKTKFASEFFVMKSEIEKNLSEINELNKK